MISTQDRRDAVTLIDEAVKSGARLFRACAELGLCRRTYRRWTAQEGTVKADGRPEADRPTPANALTAEERQMLPAAPIRRNLAAFFGGVESLSLTTQGPRVGPCGCVDGG